MIKGICKYHNGFFATFGNEGCCEKGVNYRKLVGGDDHNWVMRTPCILTHKTTIVCNEMKWPTSEEVEEDEEKRYQSHLDAWAEKDI